MASRSGAFINDVLTSRLFSYPGSTFVASLVGDLSTEVVELRRAVTREDWTGVAVRATRCLGLGYGMGRVLQTDAIVAAQEFATVQTTREALANVLRAIAGSDERNEIVANAVAILTQNNPDLLANIADSLEKLKQGQTKNVPLIDQLVDVTLFREAFMLSTPVDTALLGLSRGLLGWVHAEFNRAHQTLETKADAFVANVPIDEVLRPAFETIVEEFRTAMGTGQLALHDTLANSGSAREVVQPAGALAGLIEQHLPRLARAQARVFLTTVKLREQGKGSAAERLGELGATAGFLTREAMASHVACYRLMIELLGPNPEKDVVELHEQAGSLDFETKMPNGTDIELAKLDQVDDGKFVEIRGFVNAHEIVHSSDGKLISRIRLVDPSSGAEGRAAAVSTHLAQTGVTRESFCHVNGTFRKESQLFGGEPGVEIDRLSLAELGKKSWKVAFIDSAGRWFQPWRDGLNMYWSLGPHRRLGEDGNTLIGAGELIFPPFVRQ